jgi:hypothetical protein
MPRAVGRKHCLCTKIPDTRVPNRTRPLPRDGPVGWPLTKALQSEESWFCGWPLQASVRLHAVFRLHKMRAGLRIGCSILGAYTQFWGSPQRKRAPETGTRTRVHAGSDWISDLGLRVSCASSPTRHPLITHSPPARRSPTTRPELIQNPARAQWQPTRNTDECVCPVCGQRVLDVLPVWRECLANACPLCHQWLASALRVPGPSERLLGSACLSSAFNDRRRE